MSGHPVGRRPGCSGRRRRSVSGNELDTGAPPRSYVVLESVVAPTAMYAAGEGKPVDKDAVVRDETEALWLYVYRALPKGNGAVAANAPELAEGPGERELKAAPGQKDRRASADFAHGEPQSGRVEERHRATSDHDYLRPLVAKHDAPAVGIAVNQPLGAVASQGDFDHIGRLRAALVSADERAFCGLGLDPVGPFRHGRRIADRIGVKPGRRRFACQGEAPR